MILKTLYKELCRMYNSFFRPPNADVGFIRKERISVVYAISSFSLFVLSSFILFKKFDDPVFKEKATLKIPSDARHLKIEFDAKKFTFSKTAQEIEDFDQEKNSS